MPATGESVRRILADFGRAHYLILIGLFLALGLGGLMEAFPVGLMQAAIDHILAGSNFKSILMIIALWYGCRLISSVAGFISGWLAGMTGANLGNKFREILFEHLQRANFLQLEKVSSSEAITRTLSDVNDLGKLVTKPLILIGRNVFIFIWSLIFLMRIDWVLLLACIPLGFLMLVAAGNNPAIFDHINPICSHYTNQTVRNDHTGKLIPLSE